MKLSVSALDFLTGVITGDSDMSPRRTGPQLCDFFASFDERDLYGAGFPSRREYTRKKLEKFNNTVVIEGIICEALDFWHTTFDPEPLGAKFNSLLGGLGVRLTYVTEDPVKFDDHYIDGPKSWKFIELKNNPMKSTIDSVLKELNANHVSELWNKALLRTKSDPEGAITAARTLIESTCKCILDEVGGQYQEKDDLPKLWVLTSGKLNLAPSQHNETAFKTILGNCQSIVGTMGSLRNKISDAHGQGKLPIKPKPRHAELIVNLSGSMASFLVSTYLDVKKNN